jgi:hypothetical protein
MLDQLVESKSHSVENTRRNELLLGVLGLAVVLVLFSVYQSLTNLYNNLDLGSGELDLSMLVAPFVPISSLRPAARRGRRHLIIATGRGSRPRSPVASSPAAARSPARDARARIAAARATVPFGYATGFAPPGSARLGSVLPPPPRSRISATASRKSPALKSDRANSTIASGRCLFRLPCGGQHDRSD